MKLSRPNYPNAVAALGLLLFSPWGCALSSGVSTDVSAVVDLPASYSSAPDGDPLVHWCSDFGDPSLDQLVERALADNLTLRAAWSRIDQAQALARQAGSARWPTLELQASIGRSSSYAPPPLSAFESTQYAVSAPAAYEVDLWGRVDSAVAAAELDVVAVREDLEALAMTLAAQVAEAWFDTVHQRAVRALLVEQLETNRTFEHVILLRLGQGLASAPDIYQQRLRVQAGEAQLTLVDARLATAEQRLAVLVGRPPQESISGERSELPALPPPPSVGVPASLLDLRPDVRSARHRVEAADRRVAAAIAARLPAFRLTGSLSLQATDAADLFEQVFWSIVGSLAGPLFDGGRGAAEVDRTRAVVDERLYGYGQALLTAMEEVERSLVLEYQQRLFIEELEAQAETARASLAIERDRYLNGLADYLRVLTALQSTQQTEQQLLDAHRQLLSYRVQLCRAIGGDWTRELVDPRPAQSVEDDA